ncbi:trypsin-like serine peptidase [Actinomadura logoneensis]|uniref:trypsin-like serine peptidase n=1 Tax=Actinomadura logoneensis TaxID=2293572 RepID=UPI001314335A|nr:hypothetical protein [Actinomadura logoneensis]
MRPRLLAPAAALPACAVLLTGPPSDVGGPGLWWAPWSGGVAVHEVAASAAGRALAHWPVLRTAASGTPSAHVARLRPAPGYGGGRARPVGGLVARTTGKVFFSYRGRDFMCSGSTVRSANRDLVVTAAHCLRPDRRGWADDWTFVPGYTGGRAPFGVFTARRMLVPDSWSRRRDGDSDVGMAVLAPRAGRHVADVVGAQDIAFGGPPRRRTLVFGYPVAPGPDGERPAYCAGLPVPDPRGETRGRGVRCRMARGSSGGPWLARFDPATGAGTLVAVTSFRYSDDPTTLYAPPFGRTVRTLYARARR